MKGGYMIMSKEALREKLGNSVCKVKFTKQDGTVREMMCTLKSDIAIPHEKKTDRVKQMSEDVLAVWDCEKNAWRSFRFDSIIEAQVI
jgi:hypothetical protein